MRKTKLLRISEQGSLSSAAAMLANGCVVAFPTETVYGLGANAYDAQAAQQVFNAKGRPADNPLIVHIAAVEDIHTLVGVEEPLPEHARKLIDAFWPGPLSLILKRGSHSRICDLVTAGQDTVAVRMPLHDISRELIRESQVPIAAPSANLSGKPSPTRAEHVLEDLDGRIDAILQDDSRCGVGVESTVVDCVRHPTKITVCRPGGVSVNQLKELLGEDCVDIDPAVLIQYKESREDEKQDDHDGPIAPGMKYVHYAPNAPLWVLKSLEFAPAIVQKLRDDGLAIGFLATPEYLHQVEHLEIAQTQPCGTQGEYSQIAHDLYDCLRGFDRDRLVDVILCEQFGDGDKGAGLEQALMNRVYKASTLYIKNDDQELPSVQRITES